VRPLRHENAVLATVIAAVAIPAVIALPLVWLGDHELKSKVTLTLAIVLGSGGLAVAARMRVMRPLQTLANLTASLRERDYAVRGRHPRDDDALGLAIGELGALADALRTERWRDEETAAGLARIVEGLDAVVIAVDPAGIVRLANRAAERLGVRDGAPLPGTLAGVTTARTLELAGSTWELRPSEVRLSGMPHALLVMTDVKRALRDEERLAWQRLVRVLGHEINNSLGPIASIAQTLHGGLAAGRADLDDDLARGLEVIERRAAALSRFMQSYARLVRLPSPRIGSVDVAAWVRRAADLETRTPVEITPGPTVSVAGDPDQLDQLLINLVHNAAEATAEAARREPRVRLGWSVSGSTATIVVEDDGPGVADTANLFVPFFTTKPTGSGIGLVLARQIAEAHRGSLTLRNRATGQGAEAIVVLPTV
jgi:two-component system nitrogen regulation sensor histidine kinase NtrY